MEFLSTCFNLKNNVWQQRIQPNYIPTLEDEVEAQRQKKVAELKASGIAGTPVTAETFAAWKERKQKAKQEAVRKKLEAEFRKKKGGKGLSVLSGRDLYEYKKELFNKEDDDDEGPSDNEEMEDTTMTTIRENGAAAEENGNATTNSNNGDDTNNGKNMSTNGDEEVNALVNGVKQELFLHEDDEDLDDLEDDEDEWIAKKKIALAIPRHTYTFKNIIIRFMKALLVICCLFAAFGARPIGQGWLF